MAIGRRHAEPARDVTLTLPVRVGIAFSPDINKRPGSLTEDLKLELLDRIAAAFGVDLVRGEKQENAHRPRCRGPRHPVADTGDTTGGGAVGAVEIVLSALLAGTSLLA